MGRAHCNQAKCRGHREARTRIPGEATWTWRTREMAKVHGVTFPTAHAQICLCQCKLCLRTGNRALGYRREGGPSKPQRARAHRRLDLRLHAASEAALERLEAKYAQDATSLIRWALVVVEYRSHPSAERGACPTCHQKKGKRQ